MLKTEHLRHVRTDHLEIGYFDLPARPQGAPVAMLLHGWPDDAQTWEPLAVTLWQEGWRVVVPYLRGTGPTRFLNPTAPRTADPATFSQDVLDLADALKLGAFAVVGHDWGARVAYSLACAAPERTSHCAAISIGWGTSDPGQTLNAAQIQSFWYQWFMTLERGADLLEDRHALVSHIWNAWCVARQPDAATLNRLAQSFENPDWVEVVLHYYRVRWETKKPDPANAALAARIEADPVIRVPTLCLHGGSDPCVAPASSKGKEALFDAPYRREELEGVGHFPLFEAPAQTVKPLLAFLQTTTS